jgi:hypothetical protein
LLRGRSGAVPVAFALLSATYDNTTAVHDMPLTN